MKIQPAKLAAFATMLMTLAACQTVDRRHHVIVSVRDQRLALLDQNNLVATYPVSTSKFRLGDWPGSNGTPLGEMEIAEKIGGSAPLGAVFKDRHRTGEIVAPDSPGRDPIVTRILWLRGREAQNANAHERCIYIHGTPEERNIGRRASYGCIRMKSTDVVKLYDLVGTGAQVTIVDAPLSAYVPSLAPEGPAIATKTPHAGMVMR
jgi:lipoprotein-anchoring transpeptidase ErfK/SrfK